MKLILGYGRSGKAVARVLNQWGETAYLNDIKEFKNEEFFSNIKYIWGEHPLWLLDEVKEIILSPGVPLNLEFLKKAKERGIKIRSEVEWAMLNLKGLKIGVTGTNGKSTTTALLSHIFNLSGKKAVAGGNIGTPLSSFILEPSYDIYVIEISSFQLETMEEVLLDGGIVLNVTPDHLDRHSSFEEYKNLKRHIFDLVKVEGIKIAYENLFTSNSFFRFGYEKGNDLIIEKDFLWYKGKKIVSRGDLKLLGDHNWENAAGAVLLVLKFGFDEALIPNALSSFKPLEHRMEIIETKRGITFINDSKGTNVDSVLRALTGVPLKSTYLILGGKDKNGDFTVLKDKIDLSCKGVFCIGEAKEKIFNSIKDINLPIFIKENLEGVFESLKALLKEGDYVLLSPGCASFDQYKNYEERGKHFKELIKKWEG